MKIIRPEYIPETKKEEIIKVEHELQDNYLYADRKIDLSNNELIGDNTKIINYVANSVLDENKITFEITLTKKQKELWDKKGGIKWLKKALLTKK